jgi:glycine/D-amino acid oxidase-like deaminating enzyme
VIAHSPLFEAISLRSDTPRAREVRTLSSKPHVIVIGAGIVGAFIAWYLIDAGARVTIVSQETGVPATRNSFAWINASHGNPESYFRFRLRAMAEWRRLAASIPGLPVSFEGGILWDLPKDRLAAFANEHTAWGYGVTCLNRAEILQREPALAKAPALGLHVPEEGAVEQLLAAQMIFGDSQKRGTEFSKSKVTRLFVKNGIVSGAVTAGGLLHADHVVIAAGTETARLAATAGVTVPMTAPPGLLIRSAPHAALLRGLVMTPRLHVRQDIEGRVIAGGDYRESGGTNDAKAAAHALFVELQALLIEGKNLRLDRHAIGYRPMPKDGFPIIGGVESLSGLSLAVMHSGVTLAPFVGRLLASEILGGAPEAILSPYRLSRFD